MNLIGKYKISVICLLLYIAVNIIINTFYYSHILNRKVLIIIFIIFIIEVVFSKFRIFIYVKILLFTLCLIGVGYNLYYLVNIERVVVNLKNKNYSTYTINYGCNGELLPLAKMTPIADFGNSNYLYTKSMLNNTLYLSVIYDNGSKILASKLYSYDHKKDLNNCGEIIISINKFD